MSLEYTVCWKWCGGQRTLSAMDWANAKKSAKTTDMIDRDKPAAFGSTKDYEMRVCFAWVVAEVADSRPLPPARYQQCPPHPPQPPSWRPERPGCHSHPPPLLGSMGASCHSFACVWLAFSWTWRVGKALNNNIDRPTKHCFPLSKLANLSFWVESGVIL